MTFGLREASSFYEDMISIDDRLPVPDEYRRVQHLSIHRPSTPRISDEDLARVVENVPHLESVVATGVPDVSDRTIVLLAENALNLQEIDLSGCQAVTDVAILDLVAKSLPLQGIRLNGVVLLTDAAVSAVAKSTPRLIELELSGLPLLSPVSVRDVWSFSRKLRTLKLANCPLLSDKAFPSPFSEPLQDENEKPLPPRPITWMESLPPLILRHSAENLRVLDLTNCKITDDAVEGIVTHAAKIQNLNLSGCSQLTDRTLYSLCALGSYLDVLILAHVSNITDRGIVQFARACPNLRCLDLSFCRNLSDMSVFELSGLPSLRRLSLIRVHKLTDVAMFALAEHATGLERLYISYCDHISLEAGHILLKNLKRLRHLAATGVPSFRRKGVRRFSEPPPEDWDEDQKAVFRLFNGNNVEGLRGFLNKEEQRQRQAEAQNIPFIARSDDSLDLY
ncbi:SCF ubiquitin ligase complex subunit [Marasmius tenuissimus]|uniref:SCF ubiquitin ligase complex subunit n=1 Tax=Marasmius tenuissimus TaxID=585030 RepID=A0ABR3A4W4_9AGAR